MSPARCRICGASPVISCNNCGSLVCDVDGFFWNRSKNAFCIVCFPTFLLDASDQLRQGIQNLDDIHRKEDFEELPEERQRLIEIADLLEEYLATETLLDRDRIEGARRNLKRLEMLLQLLNQMLHRVVRRVYMDEDEGRPLGGAY